MKKLISLLLALVLVLGLTACGATPAEPIESATEPANDVTEEVTEEVTEANAEGGEGKTGHVLVCSEGYGEECVYEGRCERSEQTADKGNEYCENGGYCHTRILIEEAADYARDSADIHDAGDTEVKVTRFFGDYLTCRAEEKGSALNYSS